MSSTLRNVLIAFAALAFMSLCGVGIWACGSHNPETPAGYVSYCTQGAVFGKTEFYGMLKGPTSPGKTWMLECVNVSITPYTYNEDFMGDDAVLSKDQLKLQFRVHIIFKVDENKVRDFVEKYSYLEKGSKTSDQVVKTAYDNYLKAPLRGYARSEIQQRTWLEANAQLLQMGKGIDDDLHALTKDTPFVISSVVIDSIQPPKEVADAVSQKLATDQVLARKDAEVAIAKKDAEKREAEAVGIAEAMQTINGKLTPMYLQHEAIEAQKLMVGSPNHSVIYIPVGSNGVPVVGTFNAKGD